MFYFVWSMFHTDVSKLHYIQQCINNVPFCFINVPNWYSQVKFVSTFWYIVHTKWTISLFTVFHIKTCVSFQYVLPLLNFLQTTEWILYFESSCLIRLFTKFVKNILISFMSSLFLVMSNIFSNPSMTWW